MHREQPRPELFQNNRIDNGLSEVHVLWCYFVMLCVYTVVYLYLSLHLNYLLCV